MYCTSCGNKIPEDSLFCEFCGKPVKRRAVVRPAEAPVPAAAEKPAASKPAAAEIPAAVVSAAPVPDSVPPSEPVWAQTAPRQPVAAAAASAPISVHPNVQTDAWSRPSPDSQSSPVPGDFFSVSDYIVDERKSAFSFGNAFMVSDLNGRMIGSIEQVVSGGAAAARILLGSRVKALQGFTYYFRDDKGSILAKAERSGISAGLMATRNVEITNPDGSEVALLTSRPSGWGSEQRAVGPDGKLICVLHTNTMATHSAIVDEYGNEIGALDKKWDTVRSVITSANRYKVSVYPTVRRDQRLCVFSAAVLVNMLLHEG